MKDTQTMCQQHMSLLKQEVNNHRGEECIISCDCQKCKCGILWFLKQQKRQMKEDIYVNVFVSAEQQNFKKFVPEMPVLTENFQQ